MRKIESNHLLKASQSISKHFLIQRVLYPKTGSEHHLLQGLSVIRCLNVRCSPQQVGAHSVASAASTIEQNRIYLIRQSESWSILKSCQCPWPYIRGWKFYDRCICHLWLYDHCIGADDLVNQVHHSKDLRPLRVRSKANEWSTSLDFFGNLSIASTDSRQLPNLGFHWCRWKPCKAGNKSRGNGRQWSPTSVQKWSYKSCIIM